MTKNILLIQHAEAQLHGIRQHLEEWGYKVVQAKSGLNALMLARNMLFHLILLDADLPDLEGMDLCRRFRQRSDTHDVPIIMITGMDYRPDWSSGKQGPDDYLIKPYSETELEEKISAALAEPAALPFGVPRSRHKGAAAAPAASSVTPRESKVSADLFTRPAAGSKTQIHRMEQPAMSPPVSASGLSSAAQEKEGRSGREEESGHTILPFFDAGVPVVDPGTGLFGRPQFEAMLDKEFKRAVRFRQNMSLMLIDLDGRKRGQIADETLVKAIIALVQKTIREVDTAAWWTGESFIVLLPNTSSTDALQAAARTLESVAEHAFSWPDETRVTMSIGVAGLPSPAIATQQQLLEHAKMAMQRAQDLMTPPPFDVRSLHK